MNRAIYPAGSSSRSQVTEIMILADQGHHADERVIEFQRSFPS